MEMKDVDRENEIMRILGAFKLNPFEQLGVRFDASVDDVKRAYRKSSLMVHPDKCQHPQAREAFEALGQAYQALNNEQKLKELKYVVTLAQGGCLCGALMHITCLQQIAWWSGCLTPSTTQIA